MKPTTGQATALANIEKFLKSPDPFYGLFGSAGVGKAQPLDEPVLTPAGWSTMEDIRVGSQVYSEGGTPINVLKTFESDNLEMYNVEFSDGSSTRCCIDHLWEVQTAKLALRGRSKVMSLREIIPGLEQKVSPSKEGYRYKVRLTKPVEFTPKELFIDPWSMGYILGNGSSGKANLVVSIGAHDYEEIHPKFQPPEILSKAEKSNGVFIVCISLAYRKYYESLGLARVKSLDKFIPQGYLLGSVSQRKALLAGLLDSDGYCAKNKASFSTSSRQLAEDTLQLIRSLGGSGKLRTMDRPDKTNLEYGIRFRTPFNPFSLARKADQYRLLKSDSVRANKRIVSATYIGRMSGKCLVVDSPTRLYLTKDFTVTHNTYILSEVHKLTDKGIIGCGPTHKSVGVLQERLEDLECCTIHRFLGLRPRRSKNTTTLVRRPDYDPSSNWGVRVVLLDEASMIGTDILKFIVEDADTWDRKYIFVGDNFQLNPVNELNTPCFNLPLGQWKTELTEIVRQAEGNPSIKAATAIRDAIARNEQPDVLAGVNEGQGVYLMKRSEWLSKLAEQTVVSGPDSFRVLAYRNATVRDYNQQVRQLMGKDTSVPFSVGEYVVVNEAFSQDDQVILNTGMEFTVHRMTPFTHDSYPLLQGWTVELSAGDYVLPEKVNVLDHERCGEAYKKQIDKLVEAAQSTNDWRPFYRLSESWCDLRPLYSLTAHKSQGSTFDNVFVDFRDIYTNRVAAEADRCLYVAVTRARHNVYVLM